LFRLGFDHSFSSVGGHYSTLKVYYEDIFISLSKNQFFNFVEFLSLLLLLYDCIFYMIFLLHTVLPEMRTKIWKYYICYIIGNLDCLIKTVRKTVVVPVTVLAIVGVL
jgi:hypothetical protein